MMRVIVRTAISVLLTFTLLASSAAAQQASAPSWHLGVSTGAVFGGDLNRAGAAWGASIGLRLTERLGVEAEAGLVSRIAAATHVTDAVTMMLSGNASVELGRSTRLVPYVTVGATLVRLGLGHGGRDDRPLELAANAGGGVLYPLAGDRIRLRADLRFVHVNDAPNFWRAVGGIVYGMASR
jgi:hypothetical protein